QRGEPRPSGLGCDAGSVEVEQPLLLIVNTALDGDDADHDDGVCEMTAGEGDCSMRAAVSEAKARHGSDVIAIADGIDPVLSVEGSGEDFNASGDLDVFDALVIEGRGATVDAGALDRAMQTHSDFADELFTVSLRDLTIT